MSDASGVFFIFAVTYLVSKNVLSVMVGDILQTIQMQCAFKSSFSFLVFSAEIDPQDGSVDILNKFGDKIAHYEPLRSNSAGRGVTGILLLGEVRLVPGTSCMDTCLNRTYCGRQRAATAKRGVQNDSWVMWSPTMAR